MAVDRLVAGYNLLLAVVWGVLLHRAPYAPWICSAHLAAAALPWLLTRAGDRLSTFGRGLREIYPLLLIGSYWSELGLVRDLLHASNNDAPIAALDQAVFGVHLNAVWMPAMPQVWLSEAMHFIYFAYYLLIFLPPLVVGLMGRTAAFRDMTFRLLVTYIGCYLVYVFFPVDGPRHTMVPYVGTLTDGFFYRLVHGALDAGDSMGTAFPSSHVAGAVTIAFLGFRWLGPRIAALFAVEAVGVVLATVYTQNHFAIDSLVGVAFALTLQIAVAPVLQRALRPALHSAREGRPVPILPSFDPPPLPTPFAVRAATGGGG
jgi:hypothetical protein